MKDMFNEDLFESIFKVIFSTVVILLLLLVFYLVVDFSNENFCIEKGWRSGRVTLHGFKVKKYCISRINQTDVLVPSVTAENRISGKYTEFEPFDKQTKK